MVYTTFNNVVSNVLTKSLTGGGLHTMHQKRTPTHSCCSSIIRHLINARTDLE